MTRDPSDGSVREGEENSKLRAPRHQPKPLETKPYTTKGDGLNITSGLPLEPTKDKAKIEKSRQFIRDYFKRNPEQGT